jgi:molybdate transport system ATP-binding protein
VSEAAAAELDLAIGLRQGAFTMDLAWRGRVGLLGLFGPSGSGKTTVLEVIAGLKRPARGRVVFGNRVLLDVGSALFRPPRDRGVGYVPQDGALFPHMSVRGNALYGARRGSGAPPLDEVMSMLEMDGLVDRRVDGLSGGERQRVALARALLSSPALLLLDEPLAAVDVPRRRRIMNRLTGWLASKTLPAVHVSHDATELAAADHVLVLSEGRLAAEGAPDEVL